jgi:cadmium resistance protein CadD (predicted permease)
MLETIITSILAFVSTNIDDIFLLMLFFGSGKFKSSQIITGQYLGIAALTLASFAGSFIGNLIDPRLIGLLGFFPIYLAVKQIIVLVKGERGEDAAETPQSNLNILAISTVTIANGGDNIGVYIPLLATMDTQGKMLLLIVFAIMVYFWCITAKYLAHHPLLAKSLSRYGHIIMPIVLLALGIFILYESDSFSLLDGL